MQHLDRLTQLAETHTNLLSGRLASYAQAHQLDDAGLAEAVGCEPGHLNRLKLCRPPRDEAFEADIQTIAAHVPCKIDQLRAVLADPATRHPEPVTPVEGI